MFDSWQINLLFFYVFTVLFFQFYKLAIKNVKNDGAATISLQVIAGISVLALVPFFEIQWPSAWMIIGLLALACVFYAINDRLQLTARKHLEVSTFSIISQLSTIFIIIYGLVIFHNDLTWQKAIGALLILGANSLIFYKLRGGKFRLNKYVVVAIVAALVFATALVIDVGIAKHFNLPIYISLTLLIPAIIIGLVGRIPPIESIKEYRKSPKLYFVAGVSWALAIFFSLRALQLGEVATVITLQAAGVMLNVLAAYIFLKERSNIARKITAALLILIGVLLTTI